MSLDIEDLKQGDEIYEYGLGTRHPLTALSDANRVDGRPGWADGWECECRRDDTGEVFTLFSSDGGAYAPTISYRHDRGNQV